MIQALPLPKTDLKLAEIENYLRQFWADKIADAQKIDNRYGDLLVQTDKLLRRGGKRLRPRLVLAAYESYGGDDQDAIIKVAASQELFHSFILMHDDIIDRDLIRWGGPNISGHYVERFAKLGSPTDARHYADAWALLAGDLCYSLSFEMLMSSGFGLDSLSSAMELIQRTLFEMVGGEVIDVSMPLFEPATTPIKDEKFISLARAKTAGYSFCTPLRLGALLAGAPAGQDRALHEFGGHIGVAFQLKDDILDVYGSGDETGKSGLSDIREGKRTLLLNNTFKLATPPQLKILKQMLGNAETSAIDVEIIGEIITTSGALKETAATMTEYAERAQKVLQTAKVPPALEKYLTELVAFVVNRQY